MSDPAVWRRCSACKNPIAPGATYWVCSVSTCNQTRTALAFCTVSCWDAHLPVARHREAWAEERTAPARSASIESGKQRRLVRPGGSAPPPAASADDVLIIASRLKDYVRAK